jgi:hypothetical protein
LPVAGAPEGVLKKTLNTFVTRWRAKLKEKRPPTESAFVAKETAVVDAGSSDGDVPEETADERAEQREVDEGEAVPEYDAHVAKMAREGKLPAVEASEESSGSRSMPGLNPNSSDDESSSPSSNTRRRERRKQRKGKGKEKSKRAKKKGKARARSPPSRERPP